MELVAMVATLALLEYVYFGIRTAAARGRYGVAAPATSGHEIFERHFRVQQNTLEQLAIFLPGLFLFGHYVSAPVAAALGIVFILGRLVYQLGYVRDPERRGPGFLIGEVAVLILLLGGGIGAAVAWL